MSFYCCNNATNVTPRRAFIEQAALRFAESAIARADGPQSVLAPRPNIDEIMQGAAQAAEKLWVAVDQLEWDRRYSPRSIAQMQTPMQCPAALPDDYPSKSVYDGPPVAVPATPYPSPRVPAFPDDYPSYSQGPVVQGAWPVQSKPAAPALPMPIQSSPVMQAAPPSSAIPAPASKPAL